MPGWPWPGRFEAMAGRPEILFPLFAGLDTLPGIGPKTAKLFAGLDVARPRDLLMTLPRGGVDRRARATIRGLDYPALATVEVQVGMHHPLATKGRPYRVEVHDAETSFQLVFFHPRADWLRANLPAGSRRLVSGRVELFDGVAQMVHPDHVLAPAAADTLPAFEPVYPLTGGLGLKQMQRAVEAALALAPDLDEWIDPTLCTQRGWPGWKAALGEAHAPGSAADLDPEHPARARLAYDEVFAHQVTLALARQTRRARPGVASQGTGRLRARVLGALPYTPTGAQGRAMEEIAADMAAPRRMNRLLQGDVGAGKTLVAFMALLVAVESGGQGVLMAPTEILARQHLASLRPLAEAAGVVLDVLTGRDRGAERAAKLAALARGDIQVLVGTHAVFQADVTFADLRLAVIDEQHRFGVAQRMELGAKGQAVDVLVMTATPIPRSLALTQFGDLDISVLDEKPPGRTPVRTALVAAPRLGEVLEHLRGALAEGRRAYWVCPLVAESETSTLSAAEERFAHLARALAPARVGLVHGQMPGVEKDAAMADFAAGRTQVLVATTVIEVGVDVPEATIMVIEGAEHFGLAQLHQLRGRVGRGQGASTCLLLYTPPLGETARRRLTLLRDCDDGFRLAEEDLAMRGAGDLLGVAQSGLPRFRIAEPERMAWLLPLAQSDARALLAADPGLASARGGAVRVLLWLMEQERGLALLRVG